MKELICTCAHSNYLHEINQGRAPDKCLAYVNKDSRKEALCDCSAFILWVREPEELTSPTVS